jgi:peptidoglycan/LPS O-acetylase OafA/YrhL
MSSRVERLAGARIEEALTRPHNGFAIIRLLLALAVVVSHAFSVTTGSVTDEPLTVSTGFTLGEHAVNGFFAVSGFLVTMSFARRGWRDYVIARALRILPGLAAATLVVSLCLGPVLTVLPVVEYFRSEAVWRFIGTTLTTFKSNSALPGVFSQNPFTFPMGTVWTLKYEVLCYIGVLTVGLAGLLRGRLPALLVVLGLAVALMALDLVRPDAPKGLQTAFRLPFIFAAGAALYLWRDRVRLSAIVVLVLLLATTALQQSFAYHALMFTSEAYGVLWLALSPQLARPIFDLPDDLSYGTYLYGWPTQQALRQLFPTSSSFALLGPSLVLTLAIAVISWRLIEKPALDLKARALGKRPRGAIAPAAP